MQHHTGKAFFTKFNVKRGLFVFIETMSDAKCELSKWWFNKTNVAPVGRFEMLF